MVYCPKCGVENQNNAEKCKSCGIGLEDAQRTLNSEEDEPSSTLIILGYGCALLGFLSVGILSIVGFILGYITYRKKSSKAKTHGLIIMILNLVIILVWILLFYYI
ncbi:MAG: zinc ribbon domain-containing protein [Methanobacterium sp.]